MNSPKPPMNARTPAHPPNTERISTTPRLFLEPLGVEHATLLFPSLKDARLYEWIPDEPPDSVSVVQERFALLEKRRSPNGDEIWLNWALRLKESNTYVGTLQATLSNAATARIAYSVFPPYWRRGFAKEGCRRMLRCLFKEYDIKTIFAELDTRNVASMALLESLRFTRVAEIPNAATFKGSVSNEYRYELNRDRWESEIGKTTCEI